MRVRVRVVRVRVSGRVRVRVPSGHTAPLIIVTGRTCDVCTGLEIGNGLHRPHIVSTSSASSLSSLITVEVTA